MALTPWVSSLSLRLYLLLLLLGNFALSGCPRPNKLVRQPGTSSLPALLKQARAKRSAIRALEGRAKLRVYHPNGRRSTYRLFFQLERPNRLHFSITVAMQPVVVATSDGTNCALYQVTQKTFWRGPASRLPRVLGQFLPPQLPLEQLVPILFGELPVFPGIPSKPVLEKSGLFKYKIKGKTFEQLLWMHPPTQQFRKTQLIYKNKPPLTLEYGTFRGRPPVPKRVLFRNTKSKQKIVWIFYSYDVNPKIPLKSFQQSVPRGNIKVEQL